MGALGSARAAYAALAAGLAMIAVFAATMDSVAGTVMYLVVGVYATVLSFVGAARMPRARRRIWWAFAVAQVLFLVGDVIWTICEEVLHVEPFPSPADVAYLAQYPVLALGILWLVRGRRRGRDRAAFLDAAIFTAGVTVVGAVFFIGPAAATGGSTTLSQVVAAAYPVGDLLVLALIVRMFTTGIARNVALWALFGGMVSLLGADLYYVVTVAYDMPYPSLIDFGYLASYVLLGFAVLHPSAHILSEPAPDRPERITATRLLVLGAALVLAPITDQLAHLTGIDAGWVVLVGGCVAAVLVVMRLGDLVHSLERTAVQLAALARRDGLTGIPNRRTWDHELSRACAVALEHGEAVTVAVLDMDHFKQFNDSFGHLKGDLVLKETAAAWSSILEGRGFLARFGGEEFTALVAGASVEEAVVVLDQMRRSVSHDQTVSIGVATWDAVESPADLLARADRALYHAKRSGRDRIAVDDSGTTAVVMAGPEEPALPELRSVFQPIVDLRSGEVLGCEALSRFADGETRDVFERAHRDGTATALEVAAIRSALAGWSGPGLVGLNTSPATLLCSGFHEALPEDLTGIVLEITEVDLAGSTTEVLLALDGLRARGALIAIDDFGIGFSNLQRVVAMRPEIVKLDLTLVRGIDQDASLQRVVAAVLLLAEQTRSMVVAEGIETPAERDCLVRLGVRCGQGFLLGVPAAAS